MNNFDSPITQTMDDLNSKISKEKDVNEQLRNEKAALENQVDNLRHRISTLETQVTDKDHQLKTLRMEANNKASSADGRPVPAV